MCSSEESLCYAEEARAHKPLNRAADVQDAFENSVYGALGPRSLIPTRPTTQVPLTASAYSAGLAALPPAPKLRRG